MSMKNELTQRFAQYKPEIFLIEDLSQLHKGHKEASNAIESHFRVTIKADFFAKMKIIEKHKFAKKIVADLFDKIHSIEFVFDNKNE